MPRELWKGAIRFGLVHVPVSLYPAEQAHELDFTMLDRRDLQPVGYKRFNKTTGEEVPYEQIVKGYEYNEGEYVTLEKDDFRRANVEATQTVDIAGFVEEGDVPPYYLESPYYLAPGKHGEKGYALLRETLKRLKKVAVANVVVRTRQRLAIVYPHGKLLVLNTLRYQNEIRSARELKVPEDLKEAKVVAREMEMAERLVEDMAMKWDPREFHDTYRDDLLKMIEEKAAGKRRPAARKQAPKEAEVIDFAALLERSLKRGRRAANEGEAAPRRKPAARARATTRTRRKAAASRAGHSRRAA